VNSTGGTPSGTVQFLDGTTSLGTATLSSGSAILTTSTLGVGNHTIVAVYSGNSNFAPSTSSAVNLTIPAPSYQISVQSPTLSLKAGDTTGNTDLVSVVPSNGFSGTVNLTCLVTYTGSGTASFTPACTLAPAAVQVSGATANSTLSVLTTLPHLTQARNSAPVFLPNFRWGSGILLACLFCTLRPRLRSSWRLLIAIFGATTFLCVLVGCAGKTTPPVGTTQGSYNITISASSNPSVASPAPIVISLTLN
jgi:Bacterial Ig-like domain (group 3)